MTTNTPVPHIVAMTVAPGSAAALRAANQRRVLDVLQSDQSRTLTQAELVRSTGLASGTVSSIVREFSSQHLVTTVAGAGRRGTTVFLDRGAGLVAGVDIGHTHLAVAVSDMAGRVVARAHERLDPGHAHPDGLDRADALLGGVLDQAEASRDDVRTIGLGLPAPIQDDLVTASAILPGWVGVNAREAATARLGRPVIVENDANLGAVAEHRRGAGRGQHTVVYVKVSSGVGAGIVIEDRLFRGSAGGAGEIGHLTIDDQGPLCRCGSRGCMEAYAASGTALALARAQLPDADITDLIAAGADGNPAAVRVFEDAGLHLGWGLAAITNLINPDVLIVGGDMAKAGDLLLEPARRGLRRHVLASAAATPVVRGELGDDASLIGSLLLAIDATDLLAG